MLDSIGNGFFWATGVILFFIVFGITILSVLMLIKKIANWQYLRNNKK